MKKYPETYLQLKELGSRIPEYRQTYIFEGDFIDDYHKYLNDCGYKGDLIQLNNIEGWLRKEDALKLYELAYFCKRDILELGTYHGLSTYIIAQAVKRSSNKNFIFSVDISFDCQSKARQNLKGFDINFVCEDAMNAIKCMKRKFGFVFIDHSHAYDPVCKICGVIDELLLPGGFCLFHDWNDERNKTGDPDYGVYQAVEDCLRKEFEFWGVFGCTALYRLIS